MGYVLLQLVIFLVENFIRAVHLENGAIVTITILAGLCVIAEGLLIRRMAMKVSTPCIEKTKRGMQAIVYRSRNVGITYFLCYSWRGDFGDVPILASVYDRS